MGTGPILITLCEVCGSASISYLDQRNPLNPSWLQYRRWHGYCCAPRPNAGSRPLWATSSRAEGAAGQRATIKYRDRGAIKYRDHSHLHHGTQDPKNLPPGEIRNERVSFRVIRFENWTPRRCGWQHKQDFYYMVRAFDVAGGLEITRAVLDNTGLLATWMNMPASVPGQVEPSARLLPSAATATQQINRELGIQGEDPQYVTTYGTIDCVFAFPCLAFRQNGLPYPPARPTEDESSGRSGGAHERAVSSGIARHADLCAWGRLDLHRPRGERVRRSSRGARTASHSLPAGA
jgi:hypothetical protein